MQFDMAINCRMRGDQVYYLNQPGSRRLLARYAAGRFFVDKSEIIEEIYEYALMVSPFIAITKPRRFGKTMAANMISAFFSKGQDTSDLFSELKISGKVQMMSLMNTFNVFHIDFLPVLSEAKSYAELEKLLTERMKYDIREAFPQIPAAEYDGIASLLERTGERFMFIFDEWDAVFEMRYMTDENREAYIHFLRGLFKDRAYVHLALLTGILPIAKYTGGSPLNMFHEFNAFGLVGFERYYGYTEDEITEMIERRHITRPSLEEIGLWYDGYVRRADGVHMFNPDSVNKALVTGFCQDYWSGTGNMDDISNLIAADVFSVRDDIIRMIAGEKISIKLEGFGAVEKVPETRKDLLSAMVVYGFLTYHEELLSIPNMEVSHKFSRVLDRGTLGLSMTLEHSKVLLENTLAGNHAAVARQIEIIHDEYIPFISYSDENSLACVIMYAYYAASEYYDVRREQPSGKGYVDFLFTPADHRHIPIIMELKYNHSAKAAVAQIRKNDYILRFRQYEEVLFVGINYSTRTKKHTCLIERTNFEKETAGDRTV